MHIIELRQQYLAQCDATGRAVACNRIGTGNEIPIERKQQAHLLGKESHCRGWRTAGAVEYLEQMRRQALMQSEAAGWADVYAVALQAVGWGTIALVDGSADPGSLQTLGEREAADAATDDH